MADATTEGPSRAGAANAPGPPERPDLVTANDLVVGYDRPVLGPVSFAVTPGEVVGIWGPNGAGKSTLLKALAGSARVHAGRLERAAGLSLTYQGQQPVRLPEMPFRGREYLSYLDAHQCDPPEPMRPWLDRRVDRLSGGQFQLLTVWACLAGNAGLVLLDEPSNNLDPENLGLLTELLRTREGRGGVLLVSHEWAFLTDACDRRLEVTPWTP
jgi:ATPase subunit of ABC transporter with duplicated ATPase domains